MRSTILIILACQIFLGCVTPVSELPGAHISLKRIGKIDTRSTHEIDSSNWSVGGETMGRGFTVYNNWKEYLEPLGIKRIRLQSGWARTEQIKGKYQWQWLDEIIVDLESRSVRPWMCLCYGNPVYEGGGTPYPGSPVPLEDDALAGWVAYVNAIVSRYSNYMHEWEIWNEPNHRAHQVLPEDYAQFVRITASAVRDVQPWARIFVMSTAGVDVEYTRQVLGWLKKSKNLDLVDEITYHPYTYNPDDQYGNVLKLRKVVREIDPRLTLFQGENGAPSERRESKALSNHHWSEVSQAKWALRRMLADLGHNIPSSYFSIVDMKYRDEMNRKGLLYANEDKTVARPKLAYHALNHMTSIFDDHWKRIPDFIYKAETDRKVSAYAYRHRSNSSPLITYWFSDTTPGDSLEVRLVPFKFPGLDIADPVLVDLLNGIVYELKEDWKSLPVFDSPVVLTEKRVLKSEKLLK